MIGEPAPRCNIALEQAQHRDQVVQASAAPADERNVVDAPVAEVGKADLGVGRVLGARIAVNLRLGIAVDERAIAERIHVAHDRVGAQPTFMHPFQPGVRGNDGPVSAHLDRDPRSRSATAGYQNTLCHPLNNSEKRGFVLKAPLKRTDLLFQRTRRFSR